MGIGKKLSTGKISSTSFRQVFFLFVLIIVSYGLFTILFRNYSNITVSINDVMVPLFNVITLIILFFAFKRSQSYEKGYYHAWLVFFISLAFWVGGDLLWLIWGYNLIDISILSYTYVFFIFKTVFFCLGLYLIPKPYVHILNRYRRVIEICMVLVTISMFFWSFLILPFARLNPIASFNSLVIALNFLSVFALIFFTISLFVFYTGNLKKGPAPYLIASAAFQVLAAITYVFEYILNLYPAGGLENIFWISASLSLALAGLVQIRCHPPAVLEDLSTEFWRFKVPFETNVALIFGLIAYIFILWAYYNNKEVFEVLLLGGGILVGLAIVRAIINNKEVQKSYKNLEYSKKTYQAILNTINDALCIIDPQLKFLEVNQGVLDMYGYSKQEILGKSLDMLSAPGKNNMEKFVNAEFLALDGEHQTLEFWGKRKNNEIFPIEVKLNKGTYFGQDVVVAVARDITLRKKDEKRLKRSLDEKEAMVQEVHHRVKNNMQVVSSLLGLQSMYLDDNEVQNALQESQNRVQSMAMVHEKLYQSKNLSCIDMADYMHQIAHYLLDNYHLKSNQIKIIIKTEKVEMDIKTASPLGLIINELITNSLKYAFPDGKGKLTLKICLIDDCYHLEVSDDGVGLPDDFQLDSAETLGLQLVNRLVQQISGSIEWDGSKGTAFIIKFPSKHLEG